MSDAQTPCYLIFKSDESGQFPMYRTSEGKTAVMMFRSRLVAQAYINGKGMASEWQVQVVSQPKFVEWLRDTVKRYGASELALDPDPSTSSTDAKVLPIMPFLIELEERPA